MELFFNLYKIKYNKMMELLRHDPNINIGSNDTVNVFINLEPIFMKMCVGKVNEYIKTSGNKAQIEFIANVINLAAHYKWFFVKNRIKTRIYLHFQSLTVNEYKNREFNPDYRKYYHHKFIGNTDNSALSKVIQDSIPFIQLILEYIEGVYFINADYIENSTVPYIVRELDTDKRTHNFIVTSSIYDFQYVNHGYSILVPKQDESELLNKYNVMDFIYRINKIPSTSYLPSEFIPFILSIVGNTRRNIYNIKGMGIKTTIKTLQRAMDQKIITSGTTNIGLLSQIIKPAFRKQIVDNFYCTDVKFQHSLLTYTDIRGVESQLIDRFDNVALKKINDKYFKYYPIQIVEITATPSGKQNVQF